MEIIENIDEQMFKTILIYNFTDFWPFIIIRLVRWYFATV